MEIVETKYIVEVNEGIYLRINPSTGSCNFTDKPTSATTFIEREINIAKVYAKKCGGKIKRFTATYEVE